MPAAASLVGVTAAFTSFTGVVGDDFQFKTYINGSRVCPDTGCATGIGVLHLPLSNGASGIEFQNTNFGAFQTLNSIEFQPACPPNVPCDLALGQRFLLGWLTYENGTWFSDPEFGIELKTFSADPAFDGFVLSDTLHLRITPNSVSNTPYQNADFLYFVNDPSLGSLRAFELGDDPSGNSVTIEIWGMINSLHVLELTNATGGGFWDPSVGDQPTVPEPAPLALLLTGAGGLAWGVRRRER
jgi:hypothetical protein